MWEERGWERRGVLEGSEGSPSEMGLGSAAATPLWRRQEVSGGVSRIDATLHQLICVIRDANAKHTVTQIGVCVACG